MINPCIETDRNLSLKEQLFSKAPTELPTANYVFIYSDLPPEFDNLVYHIITLYKNHFLIVVCVGNVSFLSFSTSCVIPCPWEQVWATQNYVEGFRNLKVVWIIIKKPIIGMPSSTVKFLLKADEKIIFHWLIFKNQSNLVEFFFCSVGSNIFKHQSGKKMHRTRLCHPYSLWVPSAACKPRIQLSYLWSDILLSMRKHWSPTGWWSKVTFVSIFSHYPEELFKHSSSTALNKSTG